MTKSGTEVVYQTQYSMLLTLRATETVFYIKHKKKNHNCEHLTIRKSKKDFFFSFFTSCSNAQESVLIVNEVMKKKKKK